MSTQRGNSSRSRPQKHKNRTSFKNNLHDTSHRTKLINNITVSEVCQRCKEIIEWKIKYKKYKPLSQPKKCVKCDQRTVRHAYHVMCLDCGKKLELCTKCCQAKEIIHGGVDKQEQQQLGSEMQKLLQSLPERKRRTFIRYMNKQATEGNEENKAKQKEDLMAKLNSLKIEDGNDLSDFGFDDSEDEGSSNEDSDCI